MKEAEQGCLLDRKGEVSEIDTDQLRMKFAVFSSFLFFYLNSSWFNVLSVARGRKKRLLQSEFGLYFETRVNFIAIHSGIVFSSLSLLKSYSLWFLDLSVFDSVSSQFSLYCPLCISC
jgi:hypothetical protein